MDIKTFYKCVEEINQEILFVQKQMGIMFIPIQQIMIDEYPVGEEHRVCCGTGDLWNKFAFKESEALFFMDEYVNNIKCGIEAYEDILLTNEVFIPVNNIINKATYYFDAMIASLAPLFEDDQRKELCRYLDSCTINHCYPRSSEAGLFWRITALLRMTECKWYICSMFC